MSILGNRIASRREHLKLTQDALGTMIGKDQRQVWRYESGRHQPNAEMLLLLARALETTTDYLLGKSDTVQAVTDQDLTEDERRVIEAWRHGDRMEAIRIISTT
jgi:transcriptional regulator with XRE-family HTH domain